VEKAVRSVIEATRAAETPEPYYAAAGKRLSKTELKKLIAKLEKEMKQAARHLEFERAAELRDVLIDLRLQLQPRSARTLRPAVNDDRE
jgi:excinuclease ABC subunit B